MDRYLPVYGPGKPAMDAFGMLDPVECSDEQQAQVARLREALERDYASLLGRLSVVLRSRDDAAAALHDAYIRLARTPAVGEIRQPFAYLYRMALNVAKNSFSRERFYTPVDQDPSSELRDIAPDPERATIAKSEMDLAMKALSRLSLQRRSIFLARWRDEKSHAEIAEAFGIHKRTVQKELARAERYLKDCLAGAHPGL